MTSREQLEIEEQLIHNLSWKEFKKFLEQRQEDLLSQVTAVELKDVLVRESAIGGLTELRSLLNDFKSHIDRNTTKED